MRIFLVLLFTFFLQSFSYAENDDKSILFNTFYLEDNKTLYVLIVHRNKTFELYGPEDEPVRGTVRASGDDVTFTSGAVKRMFRYDASGKDVKIERRKGDAPVEGNLLGDMPPNKRTQREIKYLAESNWVKKGNQPFRLPAGNEVKTPKNPVAPNQPVKPVRPNTPVRPPVVVKTPDVDIDEPDMEDAEDIPDEDAPVVVKPTNSVKPTAPKTKVSDDYAELAGRYSHKNEAGEKEILEILADGQFTYTSGRNNSQTGTLLRVEEDLTFMGGGLARQFSFELTEDGLELTRRKADVVKSSDVLGNMPPKGKMALVWSREDATHPVVAPPIRAVEEDVPVEVSGKGVVTEVKQMFGSYLYQPSPFIVETLVVASDGSYVYSDSNGASNTGTINVENATVIFTSGDVVRNFTVKISGTSLTLKRTEKDQPKFKNDLASMSPTVVKEAKYTKQVAPARK
jgi:hypothetical protein